MKIGIHHSKGSYSEGWINYCNRFSISYKLVNAYHTDIVKQLEDCDIFMWHVHHLSSKDVLFAKQLMYSLESSGKIVYPNSKSVWHFDDKLGQKYLLESLKLPLIPSYAFYSRKDALEWIETQKFPLVFKLRRGAASYNVRLVKSKHEARKLINISFSKGFRYFSPTVMLKEAWIKYKKNELSIFSVLKKLLYFVHKLPIEKSQGREKGYILFQKFVPDCNHDIRVQFVGNRCYAMKRYVRKNDFRASGANNIDYDGSKIPVDAIKTAYYVAKSLDMQTLALDLIPYNGTYGIAEISYAFGIDEGECDYGYWDENIIWHSGAINPYQWMIQDVLHLFESRKRS